MEKQKNIVCGADIHKKFIMATILSRDGTKIRGRFGMTLDEILRFKNWVISNNCEAVASGTIHFRMKKTLILLQ